VPFKESKEPKKTEAAPLDSKSQASPAALPGVEHRRSQRVMIRLPVSLELTAPAPPKTLRAHTVSVNEHGALLIAPESLPGGTRLRLKNDRTGEQQACHAIRNSVEMPDGYCVAVEFDGPAAGFWHITFPPVAR